MECVHISGKCHKTAVCIGFCDEHHAALAVSDIPIYALRFRRLNVRLKRGEISLKEYHAFTPTYFYLRSYGGKDG